jgi:hypothetical protein
MAKKPDPGKIKGPGGLSMNELHQLVKKSHARDQAVGKQHNKLTQPQSRWQRIARYVWDKNRGRG